MLQSLVCPGNRGILLAAAIIIAIQPPIFAEVEGRPRLFFDRQELREIAQRCDEGGPLHATYEAMKRSLEGRQMNPRSGYYGASMHSRLELALAYLIERELGRDGSRYLDHLKQRVLTFEGEPEPATQFGWDAILFDWLYDELTPEQRAFEIARLGPRLRNHTNRPEITLSGGSYWYNQTWSLFMNTSWSRDGIGPKTMVALALVGEDSQWEEDCRAWLDSFGQRMSGDFMRAFDQLGGVWPEGAGHAPMVYQPLITWEGWRRHTGEDLFTRVAPTGFHREVPYWAFYAIMPHNGSMAHTDDVGPGDFVSSPLGHLRALHAARYRDRFTQWLTNESLRRGSGSWFDIVFYDPDAPAMQENELPPAYHFGGSGYTFMRSGFEGADDTWALFSAGPYFTAYGTWGGNGTFQIAKQGMLAGNGGYKRFSMRAGIHQNVMLVYDPEEKYFNHSGNEQRNDGGPQRATPWHVREPLEQGRVVAYEHSEDYTYIGADLTGAYSHAGADEQTRRRFNSGKIRNYTRQFLYVRGEPEFFVIYDRVEATDARFPKTWLMHVLNEPEITSGGEAVAASAQGPGFQTFQGADSAFVSVTSRGGGGRWRTDKRGAVAVRTILPENARITRRGGEGFDMWGNPHDPDAGNWTDSEAGRVTNTMDICYWRLEVEPPDRQEYHRFLHVVIPYGDAQGKSAGELSPQASAFERIAADTHDGVRLEHNGATWEITFAREGAVGGNIRISRGGAEAVNKSFTGSVEANPVPPGLSISPPE